MYRWLRSRRGPVVTAAVALAVVAAGSSVVLAACSPNRGHDASAAGALWVRHYNGPGDRVDLPSSMAVSPDGHTVFVTGRSPGSSLKADYATVADNAATGSRLWGRTLYVTGQSTLYSTKQSYGATSRAYLTVAYNTATGSQQRVWRYNAGPPDSSPSQMGQVNNAGTIGQGAVSPDGRTFLIAGYSTGSSSGPDYVTIAYRARMRSLRNH